jgi:hypothetical protein
MALATSNSTPIYITAKVTGHTPLVPIYTALATKLALVFKTSMLIGVPSNNIGYYINKVRSALADFTTTNTYENDEMIGDKTIVTALVQALDAFNSAPPNITNYTLDNVPDKTLILYIGSPAYIYEMLYQVEMRNSLDVSMSSGVQVSSSRKAQMYLNFYQIKYQEFVRGVAIKKSQLNYADFSEWEV